MFMKEVLAKIYERDLQKLRAEINLYQNDEDLWKTGGQITNSGGNLGLHLIGNLKHFFGTNLGVTDFVRDRAAEFSSKDIYRAGLLAEIYKTSEIVAKVLENLSENDLSQNYSEPYQGASVTTGWMMVHLLTHFDYHLGQINYHRRFFQNETQ